MPLLILRVARRSAAWLTKVETLATFHAWATVIWTALVIPSILWWRNSIPYLVFISVWALLATHWGAWQAARAERVGKQIKEQGNQRDSETSS